jgi:hypothetical protein
VITDLLNQTPALTMANGLLGETKPINGAKR